MHRFTYPQCNVFRFVSLLALCTLILVALALPKATSALRPNGLEAAWEKARQTGAYRFSADIRQTVTPKPTVFNVGKASKVEALYLEGETSLPEQRLHLTLWSRGGSLLDAGSGAEVKVEDGQAYARQGMQDWQPIPDFTGLFAPQGDFMAYLSAARDVTEQGTETRAGATFTRYTFTIDGPRYAAYMRDQMAEQLAKQGELPPGVSLDLPSTYEALQGEGELWVDAAGLPLRQTLQLQFPPSEPDDMPVLAEVTVDFDFSDAEAHTAWGWTGKLQALFTAFADPTFLTQAFLFSAVALLVGVMVTYRRAKKLYAALALVVVVSLVITPLLQSAQVVAFTERQAARAARQEALQEESTMQRDLQALFTTSDHNPNADPLTVAASESASSDEDDSDRDCDPDDPADNDGDGLTNGAECVLGTDADREDSDGDEITDNEEVTGFDYNGQMWYLDPLALDSNKDGLGDMREWDTGREEGDLPPDTDGDGTPDLFDLDNDGDGVPDDLDLSPYYAGDAADPYTSDAPFQLVLDHLTEDLPTFVEFQLRPTNPDHLWYAFNVMDWPDDDLQGQVQDGDGKTFYDVDDSLDPSPNDNGDLKLVPMLEVTITGDPDNLPVAETCENDDGDAYTCYPDLETYGITVQPLNDAETEKAAYVPLHLLTEDQGGERVAFAGKMHYLPDISWGNAHQVRLVWVVQALVDLCDEYQDGQCTHYDQYNEVQVIHSYDDDWFLTGLAVREDHGTRTAIIYEDPDVDDDLDREDPLIKLMYGLNSTFLAGSDCEQWDDNGTPDDYSDDTCVERDDVRDLPIEEISRRWNHATNGSVALSPTRWDIAPNSLSVMTGTFATADEAIATMAMTDTVAILDDHFTAHWTAAAPISPTMMFAREEDFRSLNLDEHLRTDVDLVGWSDDGRQLTLDLAPEEVEVHTTAGLNWAPYLYDDGEAAWKAYPIEDYWDLLGERAGEEFVSEDDEEVKGGKQIVAQLLYLVLYKGITNVVQVGPQVIIQDYQSYDKPLGGTIGTVGKSVIGLIVNQLFLKHFWNASQAARLIYQVLNSQRFAKAGYTGAGGLWSVKIKPFLKELWKLYNTPGCEFIGGAVMIFVAGVIVGIVFLTKYYLEGNLAARITLAVIVGVALAAFTVVMPLLVVADFVAAFRGAMGLSAGRALLKTLTMKSEIAGQSQKASIVGLILAVGIVWGIFIYVWASGDVKAGTVAFDMLIAQTIAATIVAILMFVLSLTVIGTIIVAIISMVDIVLTLLGIEWTITGALTEVISKIFFSFEVAVESDVDMGQLDMSLVRPGGGMVEGAELEFATTMTTTVTHKNPKDPRTILYLSYYDTDQLEDASFKYSLTSREASVSTSLGDSSWENVERDHKFLGHWMYTADKTDDVATDGVILTAGINRSHTVPLYINVGFALPGVECWLIPCPPFWIYSPIVLCFNKSVEGSVSEDIGTSVSLDVFPRTLDAFVDVVSWADGIRVRDADGDGLLAEAFNGNDPDDTRWDTDGDGLSDAWEIEMSARPADEGGYFYDPRKLDTDEDGLDDGDEVIAGTNPNHYDSDGDGIHDVTEVQDGWTFTYWEERSLRVYSSPLDPDRDGDGMDDLFERTLHTCPGCDPLANRYHPGVWNSSPIGLSTEVGESDGVVAPGQSLLYTTTVQNNLNPELWVRGDTELSPGSFTGGPLTMNFDLPREAAQSLYTDLAAPAGAGTQDVTLETAMDAQLHTPSVWDWDQPQDAASATATGAVPEAVAVAEVAGWTTPYAAAVLEDARVYVYPATAEGVVGSGQHAIGWAGDQSNGRPDLACNDDGSCLVVWSSYYVTGDDYYTRWQQVVPTAQLSGTVTTVSAPDGAQTQGGRIASDGDAFLVVWEEGTTASRSVFAYHVGANGAVEGDKLTLDTGNVDAADVTWAYDHYQVVWSRDGDLYAADVSGSEVTPYTFADAEAVETTPRIAYDTLSQRALVVYQSLESGVYALRGRMWVEAQIGEVLDLGALDGPADFSLSADPMNGGWVLSWLRPGSDTLFYQAVGMDGGLRGDQQQLKAGGSLSAADVACAQPRPAAQYLFDESSGATHFDDASGYAHDGTCSGDACPQAGVGGKDGNAVQFDGDNDVVTADLDFSATSLGVTLWFKSTCQDCTLLSTSMTGGDANRSTIFLRKGTVCARVYPTVRKAYYVVCSSGENYADGNWHHLAHTFDAGLEEQRLYVDGKLRDSDSLKRASFTRLTQLQIGSGFAGALDAVTIFPRMLSDGEVNDSYRTALAIYPFDETEGATHFINAAHNGYTGACTGSQCPTAGLGGQAYAAAAFDGRNDVIVVGDQPRTVAEYVYDFESTAGSGWSHTSRSTTPADSRTFLGRFGNDDVTLNLSNLPTHDQVEVEFDLYVIDSWDGNRTSKGGSVDYWSWWVDGERQLRTTFCNYEPPYYYQAYPDAATSPSGITIEGSRMGSGAYDSWHFTADNPDVYEIASLRKIIIGSDTAAWIYWNPDYSPSDYGCDGKTYNEDGSHCSPANGNGMVVGSIRVWATGNPGFTGSAERDTLGYSPDAVYHFSQTVDHIDDALQLKFAASQLESLDNESWGLDNVRVRVNSRNVPLSNASFTMAFWAKRSANGRESSVLNQGDGSDNQNLFIGWSRDNRALCGFDVDNVLMTQDTYADAGEWHHWACTYDADTRQRTLYRDGTQVAQDTAPAHYQGSGTLRMGKASLGSNSLGRLDELAVWSQPLSGDDIAELYQKVKVVDDSVTECALPLTMQGHAALTLNRLALHETTTLLGKSHQETQDVVTIDADPPSSALTSLSDGQYLAVTRTLVIGGDARDNTHVTQVDVSVDGGPWEEAEGVESWSFDWDTTLLSEGRHTLRSRATDAAENLESPDTLTVVLDRTPPQVTHTALPQRATLDLWARWAVLLDGTYHDPAAGGVSGSGTDAVSILLEGQGEVAGAGWQTATLGTDGTWDISYVLPSFDNGQAAMQEPTGVYTLDLQTVDALGNSAIVLGDPPLLRLDNTAPVADLRDTGPYTTVITDTTLLLSGVVTDPGVVAYGVDALDLAFRPSDQVGLYEGAVLLFPMDDPDVGGLGRRVFRDFSGYGNNASCETYWTCPSLVVGRVDSARAFSGHTSNPDVLAIVDSDSLNLGAGDGHFTMAGWVLARQPREGNKKYGLLGHTYEDGNCTPWLGLYHTTTNSYEYRVRAGFTDANGTDWEVSADNAGRIYNWKHIVVTFDGTSLALYVNGQKKAQVAVPSGTKPLDRAMQFEVGQAMEEPGDPHYISHLPFDGVLDELVVYNRALSPLEIQALHDWADVSWSPAQLAASGTGVLTTTWTYSVPVDMEGYYEIEGMGSDVVGNQSEKPRDQNLWVGEIDTQAPRNASTYHHESPIFGPTFYRCDVTDMNLDEDSFTGCPCPESTWERTYYHEVSPWYRETLTDTARLYRIEANCQRNGPPDLYYTTRVCDFGGHCTTKTESVYSGATVGIMDTPPTLFSSAYTPTSDSLLAATSFEVMGLAYAKDGVQSVSVSVDGQAPFYTAPMPPSPVMTFTTWSTLSPVLSEGVHTFVSLATDWASAVQTRTYPVTVTVDLSPPSLAFATTVVTTAHRAGLGTAILTGSAADTYGVASVAVNPDSLGWGDAGLAGEATAPDWRFLWPMGNEDPDGETYTVAARVTDFAGRTYQVNTPVLFDMQPPAPVTVTLAYLDTDSARHPVVPGQVIRDGSALITEWTPSSDGSGIAGYWVGWTTSPTDTQGTAFVASGTAYSATQSIPEAETLYAHVVTVDQHGNRTAQTLGPVVVDAPLTPDVVDPLAYHGWMESGCTQLGLDRRVAEQYVTGASRSEAQRFYTTWNTDTLRLAWTGANWNTEGDLFVYLDVQPGGATQLYNPYTATFTNTTIYLPGSLPSLPDTASWELFDVARYQQALGPLQRSSMEADYLVWVQDGETADLLAWDGSQWAQSASLGEAQFGLAYGRVEDAATFITDLTLPFSLLGIADPASTSLTLLAAASEEDALRLWSVFPEPNPLSSAQVVNPLAGVETAHDFALVHAYTWPGMDADVCPYAQTWSAPLADAGFVDGDLRAELAVEPVGTTFSLLGDDLFREWATLFLQRGAKSQAFDFLDHTHPPLGQGNLVTYTLRVANHGTSPVTGVQALVSAYGALSLPGSVLDAAAYREYRTLDIGTVAAGETVSQTFVGTVEVDANWRCTGLPEAVCHELTSWAMLDGMLFDDRVAMTGPAGSPTQAPLEWVWADHAVDSDPPAAVGIDAPQTTVRVGANLIKGYAFDLSGVPLVEVEARDAGGGTTSLVCPDAEPDDGRWTCDWTVSGSDGDTFDLRVRATDGLGHASDWTSPWHTVVVDTTPPTVTLDAEASAALAKQVIGADGYLLGGDLGDTYSAAGVEVCRETASGTICDPATSLLATQAAAGSASVYDDVPAVPVAIDGTAFCGGGEISRTFVVADDFVVGDVDLGFNALHPYREELVAELVSPSGTRAQVIAAGGLTYGFENYDVLLDDAALQPLHLAVDDDIAEPYYDRSAQPLSPLSAFNGEASAGVWALRICDLNPVSNDGSYRRAQLRLTPQGTALSTAGRWSYALPTPAGVDGAEQTLSISSVDAVGNRTDTAITVHYWLDVVPPALTATSLVTQTKLDEPVPVLGGQVRDGGSDPSVSVCIEPPDGAFSCDGVARAGELWTFTPRFDQPGVHRLWVDAYDAAGNAAQVGPFEIRVIGTYVTWFPFVTRNSQVTQQSEEELRSGDDDGGAVLPGVPALTPTLGVTVTPPAVITPTATPTMTPTVTPVPSATVVATPTAVVTTTPPAAVTPAVGVPITPTVSVTITPTITPTVVLTATIVPTAADTVIPNSSPSSRTE